MTARSTATRCWPGSLMTVGSIIGVIDGGFDPRAPGDAPGWTLMETCYDGSAVALTGRDVGGLHESLYQTDPRHAEASDFQ